MSIRIRLTVLGSAVSFLCACATTGGVAPTTAAQNAAPPATCLTKTGSRIPVTGKDCMAIGNSYSHDDIAGTGRTDVAGALGMLDPAITVNR